MTKPFDSDPASGSGVTSQSVSDLLTVILTTSVTPSAPSTELIEAILQSFQRHCPSLTSCRVIVVFDSYDQIVPQARLKRGQVTAEQASNFDLYKNEQEIPLSVIKGEAEFGSPCIVTNSVPFEARQTSDKQVTFIEPSRRLGFGLAVREALRLTETPYVFVAQHDWSIIADIPIENTLRVMQASESDPAVPIKYVCLPAVPRLSCSVIFNLFREFRAGKATRARDDSKHSLTPMFFWHDKPHICSTAHYLARVFPSRLAMLRGDFIEDKIGQRARTQMKEGLWSKWATWLYYPDDGKQLCLRHLHGRTWRGTEGEERKLALYRAQNDITDPTDEDSTSRAACSSDLVPN
ncbi:feruloyl esterase-like protein [Apiospora hydei]|uniref:Feruloyl esterase-like protein n=1 Tax=Apiospora hydei TaxID=1337664 RepID=A0ABR1WBY3_9PEZI